MKRRDRQILAVSCAVALLAVFAAGCGKGPQKEEVTAEKVQQLEQELAAAKQELAAKEQGAGGAAPVGAARPEAAAGSRSLAPKPPSAVAAPAPPAATAAPKTLTVTIPAGTAIPIRTTATLSTKTVEDGSAFAGSLASDLVIDGHVIAKQGAEVSGTVINSDPGGRIKGVASLAIALRSIVGANGESIAVQTGSHVVEAEKTVKKDAVKVGVATGVGAAVGAIAGGGRGAAIGAGAGAGAGTGVVLATRGDPAVIPAESRITFRTTAPVEVRIR